MFPSTTTHRDSQWICDDLSPHSSTKTMGKQSLFRVCFRKQHSMGMAIQLGWRWFLIILDYPWWFLMILDDSWKFLMVLDDSWSFLMILDDSWWFFMILDDSWWSLMILDDSWWSLMILDDSWWFLGWWWFLFGKQFWTGPGLLSRELVLFVASSRIRVTSLDHDGLGIGREVIG